MTVGPQAPLSLAWRAYRFRSRLENLCRIEKAELNSQEIFLTGAVCSGTYVVVRGKEVVWPTSAGS